jgi:hypothetical protein
LPVRFNRLYGSGLAAASLAAIAFGLFVLSLGRSAVYSGAAVLLIVWMVPGLAIAVVRVLTPTPVVRVDDGVLVVRTWTRTRRVDLRVASVSLVEERPLSRSFDVAERPSGSRIVLDDIMWRGADASDVKDEIAALIRQYKHGPPA